jgi:hypothetical protein
MGMRVGDLASVVRSKNAGPFGLSFDLVFESRADLDRAVGSASLQESALSERLGVAGSDLQVIVYAPANALKISMRRPVAAGDPDDRDMYGAQQHVPLLELELE